MNASNRRLSLRYLAACLAGTALVAALSACEKKADETTTTAANATTSTAPVLAKKAKTSVKLADVKSAYKAEFDNMSKMRDPMDKKVDAFVAKVGKPESDTGRKKTWYALDGDKCTKIEIDGKDGSMTETTADKADCGI